MEFADEHPPKQVAQNRWHPILKETTLHPFFRTFLAGTQNRWHPILKGTTLYPFFHNRWHQNRWHQNRWHPILKGTTLYPFWGGVLALFGSEPELKIPSVLRTVALMTSATVRR